ncbi:Na+/H+ antiporter subunit D [Brachybacterium huguangmaarense]
MTLSTLLALPVVLPLLGAAVALILRRHRRTQLTVALATLVISLGVVAALALHVENGASIVLRIGGWRPEMGIVLVMDRLSGLMLIVSSVVTLAVLVYSSAQAVSETAERTPVAIFHPTYLVLVAGVNNAFLAGDLFNLYVGFEILLSASYVLLTLGGSASRIRAATTYVIVSLLSSLLFLCGLAAVYAAVGTVNMAEAAIRLDRIADGPRMAIELVLLVAFGIKAAIFPLSAWLPDSYPTAPAPVTAVFAGLLTKVGIYAIIRLETLLFPHSDLSNVLLVAAGLSLIIGILGAIAQTDLKRVLSFTLVSHMGYMLMGIGLATRDSMGATIFYVAHHITVQTCLFLTAGLIEQKGGSTNLARLGGLAKAAPWIAILFFTMAMNVAGIPPLSGFIGKLGLVIAGIEYGSAASYTLAGIAVLTGLLTLYAVAKIWNRAFWQEAPEGLDAMRERRVAPVTVAATTGLVAFSLLLTVFAGPLLGYADQAGENVLARAPYVDAVLGDGAGERLLYTTADDGRVVEVER